MTDPRITSTPTEAELKSQFIRDYRLAAIDAGVTTDISTGPGSDADLIGTASVNLAMVSVTKTQIAVDAVDVFRAEGDDLDEIRAQDGLPVVPPSGSTGRIIPVIDGPTTIVDGTQFILPNGVRGVVVGTYTNPSNGAELNAKTTDTGTRANLAAGKFVRFVSPPVNVQDEAKVSSAAPLTGGVDAESDERKRQRILNNRRNRPAGGNAGQVRQDILNNAPGVQDAYIYSALGGPGSAKVIPVKDFDIENRDFSRACSSALLSQVRSIVWSRNTQVANNVIQAAVDQVADCALQITIPDSALSGGNGTGWTDETVWPDLVGGDSGRVTVTSYTASTRVLTVTAATTTSPVAGQTTIAWWSTADQKFYRALVTAVGGSSGAWQLTLDQPLVDEDGANPASGDYISPAAQNMDGYGVEWVNLFRALGPGEQTADVGRLPRAKRLPYITDEDPSDITTVTVGRIPNAYPEITALSFAYLPTTTPTVPADVDDPPNVLIPRHFGIYAT